MRREADRARRRVEVVPVHDFRVDRLQQLHVSAAPAQRQVEREGLLRLPEPLARDEVVSYRRRHEFEHELVILPVAEPACLPLEYPRRHSFSRYIAWILCGLLTWHESRRPRAGSC